MELLHVPARQLTVPADTWSLLPPVEALPDHQAAFFLWGARVGENLWTWTPQGAPWTASDADASVPVLLPALPTGVAPELAAYGLYLATTFSHREPQAVEWVHALAVLRDRYKWDISTKKLPPLWPVKDVAVLLPYLPFIGLTLEEKRLLYVRHWNPLVLEHAVELPAVVREPLVAALSHGSFTEESAQECADSAMQIFRRYGEKATVEVLCKTVGGTGDSLRSTLARIAQPEMARISDSRIEQLRSLRLPPRTAVHGDPSFEKDILKITFIPHSTGDWETFKDWVVDEDTAEKMRELLEEP